MAAPFLSPDPRAVQPDPVMTNVMQDNSTQGGWLAPILCSVKEVPKDFVRWSKRDAQSLLTSLIDTLRTPGGRATLLSLPIKSWLTSVVQEDAVRVEYTEEDVNNSVSPEYPRIDAALKILNVLQFATENRVGTLMTSCTHAFAAAGIWAGSTGRIAADLEKAKATVVQNCGFEPNYIRVPRLKWGAIISCDEILKNPSFFYNPLYAALDAGASYPPEFSGLKLLMGVVRKDTTPTGSLTPGFVWDQGALGTTIHIGYSPTLQGERWDGAGQAYAQQFENQLDGAAYAAREYPSPHYVEDKTTIVTGNVRRSAPETMNPECVVQITSIA